MAPHEDIEVPNLRCVFCIDIDIGPPEVVMNTPFGTRVIVPILPTSTFKGGEGYEDFYGDIVHNTSDWLTMMDEKSFIIDLKYVMKTHDGSTFVVFINGRSNRDPDDPSKSDIEASASVQTGVEKYKWMNNRVFVGKGRKDGSKIRINYYEIS